MPSHRQKIKGVIFDLDETIIGSLESYTEAFNRGTRTFGLEPVSEEKIAYFLDQGFRLGKMLLELYPSVFQNAETGRHVRMRYVKHTSNWKRRKSY